MFRVELTAPEHPHFGETGRVKINEPGGVQMTDNTSSTAPKNHLAEAKPRVSLLPMDLLTQYLVPAYEEGVIKYQRESWRQGFYTSVLVDAALRHIGLFFWGGQDWDPDATKLGIKKHHLAGSLFSLLSILNTLDTRPELDDRFIRSESDIFLPKI